ncbi:alpha/beta hydrolase [Wenzhouxiangella sp. AB-CW3]|uniref:alpha/beta fold hydrolase n=1 Tax=Wenzhouxiangella sp. AB-CW3 TaxID=2771012 RepID=UPI00168A4C4F|nr:alpha/beta hydrolase [Wenzhouxiangella sp. AB-CW3]QOC23222.1 alpha/beta hydrolase [Wenzhouxiangella sp. AB-CW3]
MKTLISGLITVLLAFVLTALAGQSMASWPKITESADGVPISFEVIGEGEPTLVFVHGWSCDGRYWREQVEHFAANHRLVLVDLAGHGHSGTAREDYTMEAFGQDVYSVVEAIGADEVILIGHSMGGPVSANAARLMPESVLGIVGVDTFQSVAGFGSREEIEQMLAPLHADFVSGAREFVAGMFGPGTDTRLRDWVVADMSAAPPSVAISAMENMMEAYLQGEVKALFEQLELPVWAINADFWPTDVETNRQYMHSFEIKVMEEVDHFLHMGRPDAFNSKLEQVLEVLINP